MTLSHRLNVNNKTHSYNIATASCDKITDTAKQPFWDRVNGSIGVIKSFKVFFRQNIIDFNVDLKNILFSFLRFPREML